MTDEETKAAKTRKPRVTQVVRAPADKKLQQLGRVLRLLDGCDVEELEYIRGRIGSRIAAHWAAQSGEAAVKGPGPCGGAGGV